ncbi:EAL domain-containing protein [Desulfopila inferna]|uniref:EAL domain-containing protein n=1 Tax=Desulfopila inferna TaxID=468528 RepID=UPI00196493C6|nr:EAL domain-containing protein [Desulfopila inferna]
MAAASTMLIDFFSFFIYAATLTAPLFYQTTLVGERVYSGIGILTFFLFLFFLKFNKEYNNNYSLTMRLRYEKMNLLEDLEQEKNQLNNRLGRIFNDSSNEIFVADADTLNCLQVNMGAIENLGYSHDEFADINLLSIFADQDHRSFTKFLTPLRDGSRETVVHKGINKRKDGSSYPVEARIQMSLEDSPPIIVVIAQDITERSEWEEKLIYQANFDQLTGMYNRHYMQSHMGSAIVRARRHRQKAALLFLDIDNFKHINDTLGHSIGDAILKQIANRIQSMLRESDTPARTGGDEFAILLEDLSENVHAEVVARKLVDTFKQPFILKEQEIYTTVSVGISIYPDDGEYLDQLMQYADMAMYQVKDDGRNNYRFFSHDMRRFSEKQMQITNHLRIAMARSEFFLYYQPKVDINSNRIIGAEALLRWHNQELGDISPDTFIPLAEKAGLIDEIGTWVLETACQEAKGWQKFSDGKVQVSVNISPKQFHSGTLLGAVDRALTLSGLPRECLELEITESLLLQDSSKYLNILNSLDNYGISLALDDFGTGYSSLSYLRRFPLQVLKIDRSFIRDLHKNTNNRTLVEAIIAMAHSLKLEIVAEGVENIEQFDFLQQRDIQMIQGYLFSPPVPAEKFRTLLQDESIVTKCLKLQNRMKMFVVK